MHLFPSQRQIGRRCHLRQRTRLAHYNQVTVGVQISLQVSYKGSYGLFFRGKIERVLFPSCLPHRTARLDPDLPRRTTATGDGDREAETLVVNMGHRGCRCSLHRAAVGLVNFRAAIRSLNR